MIRHLSLIFTRMLLAMVVAATPTLAHLIWGKPFLVSGARSLGFALIFGLAGIIAAVFFFACGSVGQFLLRKKKPKLTVLCDFGLALVIGGILACLSALTHYSEPSAPEYFV